MKPLCFDFILHLHMCFIKHYVTQNLKLKIIGKKVEVSLRLFDKSRETWFSFSYAKVGELIRLIGPSDEIDRVSKFDNSLSFGAKQKSLGQIFFAL